MGAGLAATGAPSRETALVGSGATAWRLKLPMFASAAINAVAAAITPATPVRIPGKVDHQFRGMSGSPSSFTSEWDVTGADLMSDSCSRSGGSLGTSFPAARAFTLAVAMGLLTVFSAVEL